VNRLHNHINNFLALFFPEVCAGCGCTLVNGEAELCTSCVVTLPRTDFHLIPDNSVARQFWGRVPFVFCGAFLFFSKGTKVQSLLHQFKYNDRPEVGTRLGELYGAELKKVTDLQLPDVVVPVPLHPRKQNKRGYNQSEYFATGLAKALSIPVSCDTLKRGSFTASQTKKSRFSRYENMKEVFFIDDERAFANKHVLIVDDIITTGATIEACANAIQQIPGVSISIAGIAFTS